jgi:hypothetical protein
LLPIWAAVLIDANTVLAADRLGDAQMQARECLSGTVGGTGTIYKTLAISAGHHQKSHADPQKQARQIILGRPSFDGTVSLDVPVPVSARRNSRTYPDPQELARRAILGTGGSVRESTGVRLSGIQEVKK